MDKPTCFDSSNGPHPKKKKNTQWKQETFWFVIKVVTESSSTRTKKNMQRNMRLTMTGRFYHFIIPVITKTQKQNISKSANKRTKNMQQKSLLILTIAGNVTSPTLYHQPNWQYTTDNNSMNAILYTNIDHISVSSQMQLLERTKARSST